MNKTKRYNILCRLQVNNPHPVTELEYHSPFELLIAAMLSTQTTDVSVNKATSFLFSAANTPQAILALGVDGVKKYIKSIGLYNNKAKNIIKTCQLLLELYQGIIPENRSALESLPGVGRKIANVVLNTVFGWQTIAVDTHTFRVANRTGFAVGTDVVKVEQKLLTVVPKEFQVNFHNWFVIHGRYTCISRKPRCSLCLIEDLCEYNQKNYQQ